VFTLPAVRLIAVAGVEAFYCLSAVSLYKLKSTSDNGHLDLLNRNRQESISTDEYTESFSTFHSVHLTVLY